MDGVTLLISDDQTQIKQLHEDELPPHLMLRCISEIQLAHGCCRECSHGLDLLAYQISARARARSVKIRVLCMKYDWGIKEARTILACS